MKSLFLLLWGFLGVASIAMAEPKHNILLIFADDIGYEASIRMTPGGPRPPLPFPANPQP